MRLSRPNSGAMPTPRQCREVIPRLISCVLIWGNKGRRQDPVRETGRGDIWSPGLNNPPMNRIRNDGSPQIFDAGERISGRKTCHQLNLGKSPVFPQARKSGHSNPSSNALSPTSQSSATTFVIRNCLASPPSPGRSSRVARVMLEPFESIHLKAASCGLPLSQ